MHKSGGFSSSAAMEPCSRSVGTRRETWPWRQWDRESVASIVRTLSPTRKAASGSGVCWWGRTNCSYRTLVLVITFVWPPTCSRSVGRCSVGASLGFPHSECTQCRKCCSSTLYWKSLMTSLTEYFFAARVQISDSATNWRQRPHRESPATAQSCRGEQQLCWTCAVVTRSQHHCQLLISKPDGRNTLFWRIDGTEQLL